MASRQEDEGKTTGLSRNNVGFLDSAPKIGAAVLGGIAAFKALDTKMHLSSDISLISKLSSLNTANQRYRTLDDAGSYTVADRWEETFSQHPEKPCIIFTEDDSSISYGDVDKFANKIARWGQAQGLKPKDTVALFMDNRPEYIITWLGLAKIGVAVAMINSNNKGKPLLHSIDIVNCSLVIFGSNQSENVEGVLGDLTLPLFVFEEEGAQAPHFATSMASALASFSDAPVDKAARAGVGLDDIFGYIYTSGTTGLPKACVIKHLKYLGSGMAMEAAYGVTNAERLYTVLPLYHSAGGMLGAGCMVTTGVTLVLARKFSASKFMEDCCNYDADVTQYIGELCRYLVNSKTTTFDQKHHLRIAIGNGLRREIWPGFCKRFNIPEIGEFYGATEGNVSFVNHSKNLAGYGSVGRTGWLVKKVLGFQIVKHDVATESPVRDPVTGFCIPCEPNEAGELLGFIKPDDNNTKFEGYSDPAATAKKILKSVLTTGDEYFRTGDLMRMDEEGYVYFVDRIGDTFRWKGENVSTNEVSEVVSVFPGVQEANVFGVQVPGSEDGRACMAAIVFESPDIDFEALLAHINKDLAPYAVPQFIRVLPEMEITGTFKHRKVEFVKEGFDLALCGGDALYWLNSATKKYEPLDTAAYATIASGKARL